VDGRYPDVSAVMPDENEGSLVTVSRDLLSAALRRILPMTGGSHLIIMSAKDGKLNLSGKSDAGEARDSIVIGQGESCPEIGINGQYLVDALSATPDTVRLRVTDDLSPILLSAKDCDTIAVVMPMRK
jgi:DNA polymerase III sliding clamp (beta) subunit (PCNA family)